MKSRNILLLLLLFSVSACQINKRVYRPGFSLLSDKNNKQSEKQKNNNNSVVLDYDTTFTTTTQTENAAALVATDSVNISLPEEPVLCSSNNNVFLSACLAGRQVQKNQSTQKSFIPLLAKNICENPDDEPKPHWASKTSFYLSLACIVGFFFLGIFCLPVIIASLILGIKGLKKTNENPDKYNSKNLATTGIIISSVLLAITLIATLLALIFLFG